MSQDGVPFVETPLTVTEVQRRARIDAVQGRYRGPPFVSERQEITDAVLSEVRRIIAMRRTESESDTDDFAVGWQAACAVIGNNLAKRFGKEDT